MRPSQFLTQAKSFGIFSRRIIYSKNLNQQQASSSGSDFAKNERKSDDQFSKQFSQQSDSQQKQRSDIGSDSSSQGTQKQQDSNFSGFMRDTEKPSYKNFSNRMESDTERVANKILSNDMDMLSDKMPPAEMFTENATRADQLGKNNDQGFQWYDKK
uniref:Uncharacterized protein n=1 Tax=Oxytricha trifallax TaxID=94289 RepID=A7Y481_OXYTR|nr:hypothetical protein [Sterkiella histriomuscorum]